MLQDFRKSVSSVFADRLTSPVFGAFFVSWVVINWRIGLILFSQSMETSEKIQAIEGLLGFWKCVGYPAISSLIVILVYPWLAVGGFYVWENPKRHKRRIQNAFDGKTPLTKEEQAELIIKIRGVEDRYNELSRDKKEVA